MIRIPKEVLVNCTNVANGPCCSELTRQQMCCDLSVNEGREGGGLLSAGCLTRFKFKREGIQPNQQPIILCFIRAIHWKTHRAGIPSKWCSVGHMFAGTNEGQFNFLQMETMFSALSRPTTTIAQLSLCAHGNVRLSCGKTFGEVRCNFYHIGKTKARQRRPSSKRRRLHNIPLLMEGRSPHV